MTPQRTRNVFACRTILAILDAQDRRVFLPIARGRPAQSTQSTQSEARESATLSLFVGVAGAQCAQ